MPDQEQLIDTLIRQLQEANPQVRNVAALQLADLRADQAVDGLLEAIFNVNHFGYNGTLVYALQKLDCSQKLKEIFSILFYQDYEAKLMAHQLLDQQVFEFTKEDLLAIQAMWLDCLNQPEKCPALGKTYIREMLESDVAGYLRYLT